MVAPPCNVLDSILEIGQGADINPPAINSGVPLEQEKSLPGSGFAIGAGLPPIHAKLLAKIEAGEFIEMSELLCDQLGRAETSLNSKRRMVPNILEWIKCFSLYIAVISRKSPQRVPEMVAYLTLIIEAHLEYAGDGWLGYDRRFRLRAAADPSMSWATIDTTLWNLAFSGKAKATRCKHCFSLSHNSADCELGSTTGTTSQPLNPFTGRICFDWNKDPRPGCSRANCSYHHICTNCARDPSIQNKYHKAVFCPYYPMQNWRQTTT